MGLTDRIAQSFMYKTLRNIYGPEKNILKKECGSIYVSSSAIGIFNWKITGISNNDKYIKRLGLISYDDNGNETGIYTMATRGDLNEQKNVTVIIPLCRDCFGKTWIVFQEEARPIDLARRGRQARLISFPAGIIGDEESFKNETANESAKRELKEETGFCSDKITPLNKYPIMTSSGLTDESTFFYTADISDFKFISEPLTDGDVTRGWHFVPAKNISKWISDIERYEKIPSGQTLSALYLLKTNE